MSIDEIDVKRASALLRSCRQAKDDAGRVLLVAGPGVGTDRLECRTNLVWDRSAPTMYVTSRENAVGYSLTSIGGQGEFSGYCYHFSPIRK